MSLTSSGLFGGEDIMATNTDLLVGWLERIEEKLDSNTQTTTEIKAKVFNGLSHNVAHTAETITKMQAEFQAHIHAEDARWAKHEQEHIKGDETVQEMKFWWKNKKVIWSAVAATAVGIFWLLKQKTVLMSIMAVL